MLRSNTVHQNVLATTRTLLIGGSSGIGFAVTSGSLAAGGNVHISSSNESKVASTVSHLRGLYPSAKISGSAADLSNPQTIEANLKQTLESAVTSLGGPVNHIVYTAGDAIPRSPLAEVTADGAFKNWTVRYLGALLIGKLVAANPDKYLVQSAKSSITFTSGVPTLRPRPGMSSTIGVAGAVNTLSKALAVDLAPVRVNVVLLGVFHTPLTDHWGEERLKEFGEKTLVKQLGRPEEAAEAYLYSMRSAFTTGQELVIDGGFFYL